MVDRSDVERAHRRAETLRVAGLPAVPCVGGQTILEDAERLVRDLSVIPFVSAWIDEAVA
jgi:hypothetical protein